MQHMLRVLIILLLFIGVQRTAEACHGVALVSPVFTVGSSSVTISGNSDPATCGCGPYYMEVQLACFSAANYAPVIPTCNATTWNTYPFYRSGLNIPNPMADNCVLEPYFPVTIPFAQLCPGTVYVLRARERVCGSGSAGPWTQNYTFTTPGLAPTFGLSAAASVSPICPSTPVQLSATISGSGGCGNGTPTFTWQPGNLTGQTVTVSPSVTTTYTVTAAGGYLNCYSVPAATVQVVVNPPPTVGTASVSPPTVCAGSCVTLSLTSFTNGTIQWQSSPNGITWTNIVGGTTNPYQFCPVTAAMFFRAQIIGAPGCGTATSNVVSVGVTPVPVLTITPAAPTICVGQSITLNVTGSSGYTWTGPNAFSASGSSVTVTPNTTATYTVTSGGLCPGNQTVTVTVNQLPVINFAPPSASICAGNSVTLDAGADTNTYVWTPNNSLTVLTPSGDQASASPATTTTYNVTSTSPQGCVSNDVITVTINPNPILTLSDDSLIICPTSSDTLTVSGATSYTWTPLAGATLLQPDGSVVEFAPATATTYSVIGTSGAGCSDTAVVFVDVTNNIVVSAGADDSICPGQFASLSASGGTQYLWSSTDPNAIINAGNTANPTVSANATALFIVDITNQYGCYGRDTMQLFVRPLPVVSAGIDDSICINDNTTLNASGGAGYSWTGSNINSGANTASPNVSPTATSNYVVTVTDAAGCANTDTVTVVVNPLPVVNAGADQSMCGSCVNLNATGGVQYQWTPAMGLNNPAIANPQACPQMTTTYSVTVTDANSCVNSDQMTVTVYPPLQVVASPNASICPGGNAALSATGSGGDGGPYIYAWSPAAGLSSAIIANPTASPVVTTTYVVTVSDACGSPVSTATVVITVLPLPVISVTPSVTEGCAPVCVDFLGASNPAAGSVVWDFGDNTNSTNTDPQHCFQAAGSYNITYTVTDINGCVSIINYPNMITVHPNPVAGFTVSPQVTTILNPLITFTPNCINCDTTIYYMGDTLDQVITNNGSPFAFEYQSPGTYTIVQYVVTQHGCIDSTSDYVIIEPDYSFYAPNAFTPNADGINDIFYVYGEGIQQSNFELFIFDRWGNQIFFSEDITKGWDGTVLGGGKISQIDTYVWKVNFVDINGNKYRYIGHVNLIR
jgi:gliding motility-associated-like protein